MKLINEKPLNWFCCSAILSGILIGCNMNTKNLVDNIIPRAEKEEKVFTDHGITRIDNYYWLRERDNPKVIDYLTQENNYTDSNLKHTEKLQDKLFNEIVGRIKKTDISIPVKENGYYYYVRYKEELEYPIYCRERVNNKLDQIQSIVQGLESGVSNNNEAIMLEVNEMAKPYEYYDIGGTSVSINNEILAYGVDTVSRRQYNIYFKNLHTGELLDDMIPNTTGGVTWANDNKTVFYAKKDHTLRAFKIFRHELGTDSSQDVEVYHETDDTFGTYIYKSKSKKYLILGSYSTLSTECRILEADNPTGNFRIVHSREDKLEYSIQHYGDKFYIRTNLKAKNFRLMETLVTATSKENWKEVIPHREEVLLEGVEVFEDYLVLEERKSGLINLRVINWKTKDEHYLEFWEPAYTAYTSFNPDFETNILRFGYTSMTTPSSTYEYNMEDKSKVLLKQQEVIGDFDQNNYESERLMVPARDGSKVPVSLVYKKGCVKDGSNPLLIYGYGSYGYSMDPYFSSVRLSLLDRGFVFAIAHIRGGEDLGRKWYEDGKLLKKKNTFTDFVDCSKYLIEKGFTNSDKLFAMGGSAGGLLMGAIVNMNPEIYKGVIASVPFVDVVTTMLDDSIPLTTGEYDEWGNPNEKEYFDYILSYSPYDNVERKDYPALLVTTGLHDSQVQYFEPAKWVAKLREMKTDDNILLLHTNMDAGHGGSSGRFKVHKETALEYAFILDQIGILN